jgi:hypothetical protein
MTGRKLLFSHSGMFVFEHYYHTCREWNGKTDTKKDYRIKNAAAKNAEKKIRQESKRIIKEMLDD